MPFQKVFGALKELKDDVHGFVKEGAIKNPALYSAIEQGVGLAKKIPGLSASTFGISDWLIDQAGSYLKKTREEVENVENPEVKKILQNELDSSSKPQQQPQQQQMNTPTNQDQQTPIYSTSINNAKKGFKHRQKQIFKHRNRPRF